MRAVFDMSYAAFRSFSLGTLSLAKRKLVNVLIITLPCFMLPLKKKKKSLHNVNLHNFFTIYFFIPIYIFFYTTRDRLRRKEGSTHRLTSILAFSFRQPCSEMCSQALFKLVFRLSGEWSLHEFIIHIHLGQSSRIILSFHKIIKR